MLRNLAIRLYHGRLFRPADIDRAAYLRRLKRPAAPLTYAIVFTPRCGSSRMTDVLAVWPQLGRPVECFNPGFVPDMSRKLNGFDLPSYVEMLRRRPAAHQAWGFEATPDHIRQLFLTDGRFLKITQPDRLIALIRRDIVEQAVSIDKMVQSGLSHSTQATPERIAAAEAKVVYRARHIGRYVRRLERMERQIETLLDRFDGPVLRLDHETSVAKPTHDLRLQVADFLEVGPGPQTAETLEHRKIGTRLNRQFADRFRKENAPMLTRIEARRARYLPAYARTALRVVDAGASLA